MKAGDVVEVTIEHLTGRGEGVGFVDGYRVVVTAAFPPERVRARITHVGLNESRAYGQSIEILVGSEDRRDPPCVHQGICDGCALMPMAIQAQRRAKALSLTHAQALEIDRVIGLYDEFGYRWSSKRVVFGTHGDLWLGSYGRDSHDGARMDGCRVDHPDMVCCAEEIEAAANRLGVVPYDGATRTGELRYVWMKTNGSGDVLVTLILAGDYEPVARALAEQLERPAGVSWSVQSSDSDQIRGEVATSLTGQSTLSAMIAGTPIEIGPLGFLQPNPKVAGFAYRDLVHGSAGEPIAGPLAFDLYAGAGVTTALLKQNFGRVVPCESYPESAKVLGVDPMTVEAFLEGAWGDAHLQPDLVVANPPRKGLGPQVCQQLGDLASPRLHIMSCNPQSLRRDLDILTGPSGAYDVEGARAYDTLPQTALVEVVVWLVRRAGI